MSCAPTYSTMSCALRPPLPSCDQLRYGQVWAVRHGESVHNVLKDQAEPESVWQGVRDPPLTAKGQADAESCWLPELSNLVILCSPLQRTIQTAVAIAAHCNPSVRIVAHPALQEAHNADRPGDDMRPCDRGIGLTQLSELPCASSVDLSLLTEEWMSDARTVEERIPDVLSWLNANSRPGQDVLIVSHNGVLRRVFGWLNAPHCQAQLCTDLVSKNRHLIETDLTETAKAAKVDPFDAGIQLRHPHLTRVAPTASYSGQLQQFVSSLCDESAPSAR